MKRRELILSILSFLFFNPTIKAKGKVSFVTPESFGAVGDGVNDDSDALALCFNSSMPIVLTKGKTYLCHKTITVQGKINVMANDAIIRCNGLFLDVVDGAESSWEGGVLESIDKPYTLKYSEDWKIISEGYDVNGQLPFSDELRVSQAIRDQKVGAAILFRSSNTQPQIGLKINKLHTVYGNIIIAGFCKISISDCKIIGGAHTGGVSIINGTREPLLWGYNSISSINDFKFSRGYGHSIKDCEFSSCKYNGLYVSGSSDVLVASCFFHNNGESGFKTAQYVRRPWLDTDCVCKNVSLFNCTAQSQCYDGFDVQNCFGSGDALNYNSSIKMYRCNSNYNRRTGVVSSGGDNSFSGCQFSGNGLYGLISGKGNSIEVLKNTFNDNCKFYNGSELKVIGDDLTIKGNTFHVSNPTQKHLFIYVSTNADSISLNETIAHSNSFSQPGFYTIQ